MSWLELDREALLAECRREAYQASGKGGQKRNRVYSGVRLRHLPSGLSAEDCSAREVGRNVDEALRKLRLALAWQLGLESPSVDPALVLAKLARFDRRIALEHWDYPWILSAWVSLLAQSGGDVRPVAEVSGWSASSLVRQCARDAQLWRWLAERRAQSGLPLLKAP